MKIPNPFKSPGFKNILLKGAAFLAIMFLVKKLISALIGLSKIEAPSRLPIRGRTIVVHPCSHSPLILQCYPMSACNWMLDCFSQMSDGDYS